MENLAFTIYLIDVLTSEFTLLKVVCCFSFVIGAVSLIVITLSDDDEEISKSLIKLPLKSMIAIPLILAFVGGFIPSKQAVYAMLVASTANEVMKSDKAKELMGSSLELLELTINKYKEELKD